MVDPTIAGLIEAFLAAFAIIGGGIAVASGYQAAIAALIHRHQPGKRAAEVALAVNDGIAIGFALTVLPGFAAFVYYLSEVPSC